MYLSPSASSLSVRSEVVIPFVPIICCCSHEVFLVGSWCLFSCADPEIFVRGGPISTTFFFLLEEGRKDQNTTISGPSYAPPAKRHLNGVSLACR